jgi:hypothetical protein
MKKIYNTTLITVDGVNPEKATNALKYSSRDLEFEQIKILSFRKPENILGNTLFTQIEKMDGPGYNRFIAMDLYKYIDTDFCIIVQPDGFLLNGNLWTDEFLNYDYIGAPWPIDLVDAVLINKYKKPPVGTPWIGNGGFSLRSKKILEEASKFPWPGGPEDNFFCFDLRDHMEKIGMKYPSIELGSKFSMECPLVPGTDRHLLPIDFSKHLGFHGLYPYLWKLLDNL